MSDCKFTSTNGGFTMTLPEGWEQYDDGDDEGYAFFNASSSLWTGNFRITYFKWTDPGDSRVDNAAEYISGELSDNEGSQSIKMGNFDCAHYKENSVQDGEELIHYYWITGKCNDLFICSFAIDKVQENTEINQIELTSVRKMISSIQIN